jgi:CYTH domain-containing protein
MKKASFLGRFSRRYFIIKSDNFLWYGKTKQSAKRKIYLQEAYLDKEEKQAVKFRIVGVKTKIRIKAENSEVKKNWIEAIE